MDDSVRCTRRGRSFAGPVDAAFSRTVIGAFMGVVPRGSGGGGGVRRCDSSSGANRAFKMSFAAVVVVRTAASGLCDMISHTHTRVCIFYSFSKTPLCQALAIESVYDTTSQKFTAVKPQQQHHALHLSLRQIESTP